MTPPACPASRSFRIELFGKFRITSDGEPLALVNKARLQALLAYLILDSDNPQPRERLAFLMWPESAESQARTNLRQLLHHLRHALPLQCGLLTADHQTVQWQPGSACTVDVLEFDRAVVSAGVAARSGQAGAELERLERAARVYQDDLLPAVYDEWLQAKREHYRRQAAQVFGRLALVLEQQGEFACAIPYAERLVALDELREAYHQLLIRLHQLNRDRASALRAYHQCMRTLRRELGVEPGPATRALFEQALRGDNRERDRVRPADSPASLAAPLVGRKDEWRRLMDCWNSAAGRPHLAVIAGEPGVGKSRLAEEFCARLRTSGTTVARARCYAAQGRLAYSPVAEWLRAGPLREAWSQLPPAQIAELARVLPEIRAGDPSIRRPETSIEGWERRYLFDALNAALLKAPKPLLLVIDDLQWCDPDSFEWLHSLFHSGPDGPMLVLTTLRKEETDRNHPFARLWSELRQTEQASEIPLLPLDAADTAALGCQIAGRDLNGIELARLYGTTLGNPLFVVETVRAGFAGTQGGTEPPPRVRAVIVSRFAQLTAAAYELVGFAGVLGRAFSIGLLAKATDWDEESLSRALDELWQRRIIEPKGAGQYDFTHDLLREVAYTELSPVRKRFLHRRAARALEEMYREDLESVASHLAAHCASGDLAEEAIRYYRIAADAAHQRYADSEAAAELRRALALCRDMPATGKRKEQELELLIALERALVTTLGYAAPELGETSERALALFRELKAGHHGVAVLSSAWIFRVVRGEFAASGQIGEELLELAARDGRPISSVAAHFGLGCVCFHLGQFGPSREHMEHTLEAHSKCSAAELAQFATPGISVFCRSYITHVLWHCGLPDLALRRSEEALAAAARTHPFGLAIALAYAALLDVFRGESAQALEHAQQAAALCDRYDIAYYSPMARIVAGWSRAVQGDTEAGLAELRKGLTSFRATGAELRLPLYYALLAEACARAGQPAEALANIANGLAFESKNGEIWAVPYLHLIQGAVFLEQGNRADALGCYHRALESAWQTGARVLALRAATRICQADAGESLTWRVLAELYDGFTEGFETPDLEIARGLLGRRTGAAANRRG